MDPCIIDYMKTQNYLTYRPFWSSELAQRQGKKADLALVTLFNGNHQVEWMGATEPQNVVPMLRMAKERNWTLPCTW